jgi:hypothetical protein
MAHLQVAYSRAHLTSFFSRHFIFTDGMKLKSMLGQGYRTPHGAVTDEYGVMVARWSAGEIRGIQRKSSTEPRRPLLF